MAPYGLGPTPGDAPDRAPSQDPDGASESDSGSEDESTFDPFDVKSPYTDLRYDIHALDDEAQEVVKEALEPPPDGPKITLQYCVSRDGWVAFQIEERVRRSIRIGSPESPYSSIRCSCSDGGICKHTVFLSDRINRETLSPHDFARPLVMERDGSLRATRGLYQRIKDFHIDMLADSLHIDKDRWRPNPNRVREARDILATFDGIVDADSLPVLSTAGRKNNRLLHPQLSRTAFNMLVDDHVWFAKFYEQISSSNLTSKLSAPRRLGLQFAKVLDQLDKYYHHHHHHHQYHNQSLGPAAPSSPHHAAAATTRWPCDVLWAASHIERIVSELHGMVVRARTGGWRDADKFKVTELLVRILQNVVGRNADLPLIAAAAASAVPPPPPSSVERNLYRRLVGDSGTPDFVIGDLVELADKAVFFRDALADAAAQIERHGSSPAYYRRLQHLLRALRPPTTAPDAPDAPAHHHAPSDLSHMPPPPFFPVGAEPPRLSDPWDQPAPPFFPVGDDPAPPPHEASSATATATATATASRDDDDAAQLSASAAASRGRGIRSRGGVAARGRGGGGGGGVGRRGRGSKREGGGAGEVREPKRAR